MRGRGERGIVTLESFSTKSEYLLFRSSKLKKLLI